MLRVTESPQRFIGWMATLAVVLVVLGDARAGESTRLAYLRGEGAGHCPDEKALRAAVAVRLGYDPFVAWAKTTVHAQLGHDGSNLRARVYLADENGHIRGSRELSAPLDACNDLIAAVALAISIAIDPMSVTAPRPPPAATGNTSEAPEQTRPESAIVATAPPASSKVAAGTVGDHEDAPASPHAPSPLPKKWYAGLGTHLVSGTAPNLASGLSAFARLDLAGVSLALEGRYDLPASASALSGPGVVSSTLLLASLEPCARVSPLYFCGLVSVGALRGSGAGVAIPSERSAVYWGAGGRVALEIAVVAPMLLRAHLDLVGNGTRSTLAIDGAEVWRAPPFAAAAGISVVARVW